jgi:D-sedoheptulose 7-phosphate isomerase
MSYYQKYLQSMHECLAALESTNAAGEVVPTDQWLEEAGKLTEQVKESCGRMFFVGNGASAAFASHMSLDWSKNGGVPCIPLFDLSHLTALGNDLGYDDIFSTAVGWHGKPGDLLITISSSGNSPNIIKAIEKARSLGMKVVTLSGLKPDNKSRQLGDINLYIPAKTYGIVECAHQVILHAWLDCSMNVTEWEREEVQNMRADEFSL